MLRSRYFGSLSECSDGSDELDDFLYFNPQLPLMYTGMYVHSTVVVLITIDTIRRCNYSRCKRLYDHG